MKGKEISMTSPIFEDFIKNLNNAVNECLHELNAENFSGGDITAKISIELEDAVEVYPESGKGKEATQGRHHYKKPNIEHKVALTLKKKSENKGGYSQQRQELVFDEKNNRFILVEVKTAQVTLSEMGDDHEQ